LSRAEKLSEDGIWFVAGIASKRVLWKYGSSC
jgi:hypothetical protein